MDLAACGKCREDVHGHLLELADMVFPAWAKRRK
jgi:hypothetical protein